MGVTQLARRDEPTACNRFLKIPVHEKKLRHKDVYGVVTFNGIAHSPGGHCSTMD